MTFPEMSFTPARGTPPYEADRSYWEIVIGLCCTVCGQPIGQNVWMLTWEPHRRAHLACWEDRIEAEAQTAKDPWLSEVSATRLRMTIAAFGALPNYQRFQENQLSRAAATSTLAATEN